MPELLVSRPFSAAQHRVWYRSQYENEADTIGRLKFIWANDCKTRGVNFPFWTPNSPIPNCSFKPFSFVGS
jgi:hypothetical protein